MPLELKDIYIGKPVKTTTRDGIHGVLRIDEYEEKIICIPLNSIDNEVREFKLEELKGL